MDLDFLKLRFKGSYDEIQSALDYIRSFALPGARTWITRSLDGSAELTLIATSGDSATLVTVVNHLLKV